MSALVAVTSEVISFSKTDFINTPLLTNIGKTRFVFFSGVGPGFVWVSVCAGRGWPGSLALVDGLWDLPLTWGTSFVVEVEGSHHLGGQETPSALPLGADSSPWGQIPEELSCETGHGHSSGHLWAGGMKPNWDHTVMGRAVESTSLQGELIELGLATPGWEQGCCSKHILGG